jgi:hypothetical protein
MDLIAVTWFRSKWVSAVVASVAGLACCRGGDDASPGRRATSAVDVGNQEFVPAALPEELGSDTSCTKPHARPDLCRWARERDSVLIGEIISVEAIQSPVWVVGDNGSSLEDGFPSAGCPGGQRFGVEVGLKPLWQLSGPSVGDDTVLVRFGGATIDSLGVVAKVGENGEVVWMLLGNPAPPFEIGAVRGVGGWFVTEGKYFSSGSHLPFTFNAERELIWPDIDDCGGANPVASHSTDFDAFVDRFAACDSQEMDGTMHEAARVESEQQANVWIASDCAARSAAQ